MNSKITLRFLVAVTLFQTPYAAKCRAPFTCQLREECQTAHEPHGGLGNDIVLFRCSSGGRSKRVCCPEIPKTPDTTFHVEASSTPSTPNFVTPTTESPLLDISSTSSPIITLKSHPNYALLPKPDECGRNALEKLKKSNTDFDPSTAILDHKVVNGQPSPEGAYPWMALLFFAYNSKPKKELAKCGGSLISSRYVLTAAHCFNETEDRIKYVRLAEHNYKVTDCKKKTKKCPENVKVEQIIIHKEFNVTSVRNDIALLRLEKEVLPTENPKISPICLPFDVETRVAQNETFHLAGWGKLDKNARQGSSELQELTIQANGQCSTCPKDRPAALQICPLSETKQLCIQVNRKKSPCQGDSGGPLMIKAGPNHMVQVGVISLMPGGCGETGIPAIYTRVDGYLDWILDNIKP